MHPKNISLKYKKNGNLIFDTLKLIDEYFICVEIFHPYLQDKVSHGNFV